MRGTGEGGETSGADAAEEGIPRSGRRGNAGLPYQGSRAEGPCLGEHGVTGGYGGSARRGLGKGCAEESGVTSRQALGWESPKGEEESRTEGNEATTREASGGDAREGSAGPH